MERRQAARTRRSQTDSLDLLIRGTLYAMLFFEVFLFAQVPLGGSAGHVVAGLLLGAVHAAACAVVLRAALGTMLTGQELDRRLLIGFGAASLLVLAVSVALAGGPDARGTISLAVMIVASFGLFALAPVMVSRTLTLLSLAVTGITLAVVLSGDGLGGESALPVVLFAVLWPLFLVVVAGRMTCWMLSLVWQLDAARTAQAQLAVAEERLRFSRDLHDVVGRTLSVVAVKSELAAELARRGLDGAAEQMLEVRQIAQESLREVRTLAVGYRTADLDAELAGARSLLRSAGIDARTTLDAELPGPAEREVLAWVVREGTTNVVRHSDARWCTLVIVQDDDGTSVRLVITNDGIASGAATPVSGTGLTGLRERLSAVGGRLDTRVEGETFVVTATVPAAPAPAPAASTEHEPTDGAPHRD
ncbi:signal transduction histidine kinase [Sanguibacter keddieii DSM 10542]|uniref:Signal transduction histidine kinase n=1 Tax=Sanguibacter keddieii (strain ATCC 51767 / DSM 10542 / NCFB 3025 / ST-74) TaxID=446469 RepID=D1BK75_SANKS|nr:histidine kinase [Sanguibacter keddieii]ACZ20352.1 signal transduction histidine kinase [Sanguibacter keddieii DSM 10542]